MTRIWKMPLKLVILYTHVRPLMKAVSSPLLGFGGWLSLLQLIDVPDKPTYAIIGGIIIAILSYLAVRAKANVEVKVKEIGTTESAEASRLSIAVQLFDRGMLEAKEARDSFKDVIAELRAHFSNELKEARTHYEERETELRQHYHDRLTKASEVCDKANTKLIKVQTTLRSFGIEILDDGEIRLPKGFEETVTRKN